jgi:hypothetical protein
VVYLDLDKSKLFNKRKTKIGTVLGLYSYPFVWRYLETGYLPTNDANDEKTGDVFLPFKDGSFDALYYSDPDNMMHKDPEGKADLDFALGVLSTYEMLRVIKNGGFVIYDSYRELNTDCIWNIGVDVMAQIPGLKKLYEAKKPKTLDIILFHKEREITYDEVRKVIDSNWGEILARRYK